MRLALEFVDDEESTESLRNEIREMEKIVVALLEAERLNSRHAQLTRTDTNVKGLVSELIDDFFSRERDRIRLDIADDTLRASLDEARITLMLKNLVANALRYSRPEDGPVVVSATTRDGELVLGVRDHGPGLSRDQAEHIGEPFYRSDKSRTRESGGTGLGLYLAALVAAAHGGSLELLDTGDYGAAFEARIPLTTS